jgi:uncharacterized protein (TIGR03086 family)
MTTALWSAVELLERSLGYTRGALTTVTPDRLGSPTPCAAWDLGRLLGHMDDSLDAFTEAATGSVSLVAAGAPRLESIRAKACSLLGWWCTQPPETVRVGGTPLPADLLVGTAALEITVHGWDVHQALGRDEPVPEQLARALLPIAWAVVTDDDRPHRFAPPVPTAPGCGESAQLLGFLGRR